MNLSGKGWKRTEKESKTDKIEINGLWFVAWQENL
jgi:hypothetical protein